MHPEFGEGISWETSLVKPRRCEDNINVELREMGCVDGTDSGSCKMAVFGISAVELTIGPVASHGNLLHKSSLSCERTSLN
jgi:hypothetical protein